jgi:hypothetical protein
MPSVTKYLESSDRLIKSDVEIEKGQDYEWIIDRVTWEELDNMGKIDHKWTLWFRGQDKMFPLNKTNCRMVTENLGSDDTDDWVGRKIVLFRTMTQTPSGMKPCIRIRPKGYNVADDEEPGNILQGDDDIPFE